MTEVWVAVAAGVFTLGGTVASALLTARASQRSVATLQALVPDDKLPAPVRAEAAAMLMHAMHRTEGNRAITGAGILYFVIGLVCLTVQRLGLFRAASGGVLGLVGLLALAGGAVIAFLGWYMGGRVDSRKHQQRVSRTRRILDEEDS